MIKLNVYLRYFVLVFSSLISPVLLANVYSQAMTDEHLLWQRTPIKITLPVGQERLISFPQHMQLGYDEGILPVSTLRVENDNQTLYLLAKKPFATQRVKVKLSNGEVILLDLKAQKNADTNPVDIVLPKLAERNNDANYAFQNKPSTHINYVTLTRYAIQQLYAPQSLLKENRSMVRFPMRTQHLVPLFEDGSALAMPLVSWRGGDNYITAILVKNQLHQSLPLTPDLLCGEWKTASFYPTLTLAPKGTSLNRDTTTLFLISDRPFFDALQSCLD